MVNVLKLLDKNDYLIIFKHIVAEPIDKFKSVYEVNILRLRDFNPSDFNFKGYNPGSNCLKDCYDFSNFFSAAAAVYSVYDKVKHAKSFTQLVILLNKLLACDVVPGFPQRPYYNFDHGYGIRFLQYLQFYVVTKWLRLKPNKKFKPVFEQVAYDLKDKVWW